MTDPVPPGLNPNLAAYWNKPVSELATIANSAITPQEAERHRIYSLATMAIVALSWNGNKRGQDGEYPWRSKQRNPNGTYKGDRYLGHNIACIAVDADGEIIDFDFNHNDVFNSSAEHAEARLVRRIFNLNQIYDDWRTQPPTKPSSGYGNILTEVTIYTSLESCAQCSGIMTLGNVKAVVYLQTDPGQYRIGNTMFNLTRPLEAPAPGAPAKPKYGAPEPIDASLFNFERKKKLDDAFVSFAKEIGSKKPFFIPNDGGKLDVAPSITSFLCTDAALDVYSTAEKEVQDLKLEFPDYVPNTSANSAKLLANEGARRHALNFLGYVRLRGLRATPHR